MADTTLFSGQGTGLTTHASGTPDRPYDEIDISRRAFWESTAEDRERTFATLRAQRPITWQPPFEDNLLPVEDDYGFWAITTHRHVAEVTKRSADFLCGPGIVPDNLPAEILEAGQSIIAMDPPRHTKLRRLLSAAFTPKQLARVQDRFHANARRVVDNLLTKAGAAPDGRVDWVAECGAQLPMLNFNDLMGVPAGERERASHEMSVFVSRAVGEVRDEDPQHTFEVLFGALTYMHQLSRRLVTERRERPQDDLFTALATAEVDGEQLTDHEIGAFFVLLTIGGNDTTRHTLAHGMRALTTHPEQREWLLADLDQRMGTAVEEMIRWATPTMTLRRTAAHDTELDGVTITAGDKLIMVYSSANRDEQAIDRPHEFDLSRRPNPHLSFGGGGIHHCLGSQLARFQLRALFDELLTRCPDIVAEEPELAPNNLFHVVRAMPCRPTPS